MTNYTGAIDEIFGAFKDVWANTDDIVGYVPVIRWPGIEEGTPDASKFWTRISQQTVLSGQKTLSNTTRIFETSGLIFIQIFCPKSIVNSFNLGRQLAQKALETFRSRTSNVRFINARIQELPSEENFYRFNVVSEYDYWEVV